MVIRFFFVAELNSSKPKANTANNWLHKKTMVDGGFTDSRLESDRQLLNKLKNCVTTSLIITVKSQYWQSQWCAWSLTSNRWIKHHG